MLHEQFFKHSASHSLVLILLFNQNSSKSGNFTHSSFKKLSFLCHSCGVLLIHPLEELSSFHSSGDLEGLSSAKTLTLISKKTIPQTECNIITNCIEHSNKIITFSSQEINIIQWFDYKSSFIIFLCKYKYYKLFLH